MAIIDRTDPIFLTTNQSGQRPELMLSAVRMAGGVGMGRLRRSG